MVLHKNKNDKNIKQEKTKTLKTAYFQGFTGTPDQNRTDNSSLGGTCYIHLTTGACAYLFKFGGGCTYHLGGACTMGANIQFCGTVHTRLGGGCNLHFTKRA